MDPLNGNNAKPGDKVQYVDDSPTAFGPGPGLPTDKVWIVEDNYPNGYGSRLLLLKGKRCQFGRGGYYAWRFRIIPPEPVPDKVGKNPVDIKFYEPTKPKVLEPL